MLSRALLIVVVLSTASCYTVQVGDFTLLANEDVQLRTKTLKRNLHGEHCTVLYTPQNQPSIERAVDKIHDQAGGESVLLQNVVVEYHLRPLHYFLYGKACYRVEADVVELE